MTWGACQGDTCLIYTEICADCKRGCLRVERKIWHDSKAREGAQESVREGNWTRDALCMTGAYLGGIGHTPPGDSPEICGYLVRLRGDRWRGAGVGDGEDFEVWG